MIDLQSSYTGCLSLLALDLAMNKAWALPRVSMINLFSVFVIVNSKSYRGLIWTGRGIQTLFMLCPRAELAFEMWPVRRSSPTSFLVFLG